MEALIGQPASDISMETKWGKMLAISLVLHLAVFSMVLFVPEAATNRRIQGTVYEVNLVELPRGKPTHVKKGRRAKPVIRTKTKAVKRLAPAKTAAADKIARLQSRAKPLVVAKKTVKAKTQKPAPAREATQDHINQALERIKRNVQAAKTTEIDQTPSRMEVPAVETGGGGPVGRAENGILIHMYRIDVYDQIKSNWSFPAQDVEGLSAIVVLTVQNNGTILKTTMTQPSGNGRFDQSVLKAIKRSDPLPPFPAGYRKTHEEIEINFNLRDLENL